MINTFIHSRGGRRWLPSLAAIGVFMLVGCDAGTETAPTPPPGNPASERTSTSPPAGGGMMARQPGSIPAPTGPVAQGGDFNRHFPKDGDGFDVVFTQEKKGFAMAELRKGGKKVATLSVSDIAANLSALEKYNRSTQEVGGYPASNVGSQGSSILVGEKFQVQVRSTDSSFSARDREAWLQKFDLSGLANMAK
ncbi:MAG: hypothetical protein SFU56_06340 [Capsulimonadales bacterium]|nr:hypothetical protein [Capsulimonadales bacterium]